jgi:hypothetical protein
MWWFVPIIPALKRWRQGEHQFEVSLGYKTRLCIKKT